MKGQYKNLAVLLICELLAEKTLLTRQNSRLLLAVYNLYRQITASFARSVLLAMIKRIRAPQIANHFVIIDCFNA